MLTLVFEEIESGWPLDEFRKAHEQSVTEHDAFGVPTFVSVTRPRSCVS